MLGLEHVAVEAFARAVFGVAKTCRHFVGTAACPDFAGRNRNDLIRGNCLRAGILLRDFREGRPLRFGGVQEIDILVKGADWGENAIVGRDVVEARGGKVVRMALAEGYSTTTIIEKVRLKPDASK